MQEVPADGRPTGPTARRLSRKFSRIDEPSPKQTAIAELPTSEDLANIHQKTQHLLASFDSEIKKCKRFNEVKTHRKYEVMIRDLEIQNEQLAAKLQKEQLMRSPTKDYMTELLQKIVELKRTVDQLKQQIADLNAALLEKQEEVQEQKLGIARQQQLLRMNVNKLPQLQERPNESLKDIVRKYVETVTHNAQTHCLPVGKYVSFLKTSIDKFKSVEALLRETKKWCDSQQGENKDPVATPQADLWRVKYTISKAVSEHDKSLSPLARKRISLATLDTSSYRHRGRPLKTEAALSHEHRLAQI